jgi:hypothetical protein
MSVSIMGFANPIGLLSRDSVNSGIAEHCAIPGTQYLIQDSATAFLAM